MYCAVKAKYEQNPQIAAELMQTQSHIEAAPGEHWQEENSRILERVRRELREAAAPVTGSYSYSGVVSSISTDVLSDTPSSLSVRNRA